MIWTNFLRRLILKRLLALLLLMAVTLTSLCAYQVSPLSAEFDARGKESSKVYTITNDGDRQIAIELKAYIRKQNPDGSEKLDDASMYFTIQPSKVIIAPGSSQLVRVQYRGPQPKREANFRIIADQIALPVSADDPHANDMINFLFVYSTVAYVRPQKVVEKVQAVAGMLPDGRIKVEMRNTGSVHQVLSNLKVKVSGPLAEYEFSPEELDAFQGYNILTGTTLQLISTEALDLGAQSNSDLRVRVSYDYEYKEMK